MVKVQVLKSAKGFQSRRLESFVARVREEMPNVPLEVVDLAEDEELMKAHNLLYGPAVLIDDRLDFIGIPSMAWFRSRLEKVEGGATKPAPEAPTKSTNTAQQ